MSSPLRILYATAPGASGDWRAAFDLAQAAAAFDLPIEIGCCGAGLGWLMRGDAQHARAAAAFASLSTLGVCEIRVPVSAKIAESHDALLLQRLDAQQWRSWLRAGALQVW